MKRLLMAVTATCVLTACGDTPTAVSDHADLAPAFALSAADLAGPTDVTYGMLHGSARIWNTQITAVGAGTFSGNAAIVAPGSSVTVSGNFQRGAITDMSYCPGCIIQNYIAWVPDAAADGATPINAGLQSGGNYPGGPTPVIAFTFNTSAPTAPGTYYIGMGETWDYVFQPWAQGRFGTDTNDASVSAASFTIKVRANPATKDDCKNGGWATYEFSNQGLCVRYIETGKDSR